MPVRFLHVLHQRPPNGQQSAHTKAVHSLNVMDVKHPGTQYMLIGIGPIRRQPASEGVTGLPRCSSFRVNLGRAGRDSASGIGDRSGLADVAVQGGRGVV